MKSRPLTKKQKQTIEMFKRKAGNVTATCEAMNIGRAIFYHWRKTNSKFNEAIEDVNESLIDFAESVLLKNIKEGKETSLIFFLKTKAKHRGYVEGINLEHSGNILNELKIEVIDSREKVIDYDKISDN